MHDLDEWMMNDIEDNMCNQNDVTRGYDVSVCYPYTCPTWTSRGQLVRIYDQQHISRK